MELEKLQAKNDLFYLAKNILGYDKIHFQPHDEVCRFIEQWNKRKKMLLLPRGSFKTSIGSIAYSIQQILQNPDIRILLASETYHQAITILREIKAKFESEQFKKYYGDWRSADLWRESEIAVNRRKIKRRDPTVSCMGIDVSRTGAHFDLIIVDDPHSQKNVTTRDQIEQTKDWYRLLLSMLEPSGRIMIIGTKWDFDDLYGLIEKELSDEYDLMVKKAINDDGTLFFPSRLTQQFLEEQRKEQGDYIFSCQYLLDPIPHELQTFKPEWIKFYEDSEVPDNLSVFIACDPALTEDQRVSGDDTAMVVVGVAEDNYWYILDIVAGHFSPDQINEKLYGLYAEWGPLQIGIETESFGKLLKPSFEKYMWDKGSNPYVVELKSGGTKKELRIKSLQPLYQQGKVLMKKPDFINKDQWAKFYEQLIHFPKSSHDDILDATAYINQMVHYKPLKPKLSVVEQRLLDMKKNRKQSRFNEAYSA